MLVLRWENQRIREKRSRNRVENQQTQPTYGVWTGNRTQGTMVESELRQHCSLMMIIMMSFGQLTTDVNGIKPSKGESATFICSSIFQLNVFYFQGTLRYAYPLSWLDFPASATIIPFDPFCLILHLTLDDFNLTTMNTDGFIFKHYSVFYEKSSVNIIGKIIDDLMTKQGHHWLQNITLLGHRCKEQKWTTGQTNAGSAQE